MVISAVCRTKTRFFNNRDEKCDVTFTMVANFLDLNNLS